MFSDCEHKQNQNKLCGKMQLIVQKKKTSKLKIFLLNDRMFT